MKEFLVYKKKDNQMFKLYFQILKKSFKSSRIYSSNVAINIISGFIRLFVQISLWIALYKNGFAQKTTLSESMTYTILSLFIINSSYLRVGDSISDLIYTGNIEVYMLQPAKFREILTFRVIGQNLLSFFTFSLPMIIISCFFVKICIPSSLLIFSYAFVSFLLGQIIFWLFECILGYTAFWLQANWYVIWLEIAFMSIFGGTRIPLWFYPKWLDIACDYLPFRYTGYEAIEIFVGKKSPQECIIIFLIQLMWIIALLFLESLLRNKALKKLLVNGG